MAQALLATVQNACAEMSLPIPTVVAASTDPQVRLMLAALNGLGRELAREYPWQRLQTEYLFTSLAVTRTCTTTNGSPVITMADTTGLSNVFGVTGTGIASSTAVLSVDSGTQITLTTNCTASGTADLVFAQYKYALPVDWNKIAPQTEWDRSNRWPLLGPKSPQEWAFLKGGIVSTGPRVRFRIKGNWFEVFPYPANGYRWSFEYVSNAWAIDGSTGAGKPTMSSDTDTCIYDDRLMELGLIWKFKQAKGFDSTAAMADYRSHLSGVRGQDQDAPTLAVARRQTPMLLNVNSIPETGYGS